MVGLITNLANDMDLVKHRLKILGQNLFFFFCFVLHTFLRLLFFLILKPKNITAPRKSSKRETPYPKKNETWLAFSDKHLFIYVFSIQLLLRIPSVRTSAINSYMISRLYLSYNHTWYITFILQSHNM